MYLTSAQIKGKINSLAKQKGSDPISLLKSTYRLVMKLHQKKSDTIMHYY